MKKRANLELSDLTVRRVAVLCCATHEDGAPFFCFRPLLLNEPWN
jgi:hypothetical protein